MWLINQLEIENQYGNVDIRRGCPDGYTHIKGARLQTLCSRHRIWRSNAMIGFKQSGRGWRADCDGVLVHTEDAELLEIAIADRKARRGKTTIWERRKTKQLLTFAKSAEKDRLDARSSRRMSEESRRYAAEHPYSHYSDRERERDRDPLRWQKFGF